MSVAYEETQGVENDQLVPPRLSALPPMGPPRRPHRNRRKWLAALGLSAMVVVAIAVESVPPGTPGQTLWTSVVGGGTVVAAAPGTPAAQADPQLAAIEQVVQRANAEQAQAIAAQNPSVMSDTATPAHYQQLT